MGVLRSDRNYAYRMLVHRLAIGLGSVGVLVCAVLPSAASSGSLKPCPTALATQNRQARAHDFTFLRNPAQVSHFVRQGWLVRLPGNRDYALWDVSFPYVRPETKLFVERLSSQYREVCGEPLVVTSATRPRSHQPRNASPASVHPTGMALDLRRPSRANCRRWLEDTLLFLEGRGVLEATRERRPPHYHLAVFPEPYRRYVENLSARDETTSLASLDVRTHHVRHGETLWAIARRYDTSVGSLRALNHLAQDLIRPGQVLNVPGGE